MGNPFEEILSAIEELLGDNTVPKNIKKRMDESKGILLQESDSPSIRANKALSKLDELSEETNIPAYTRTQIWNIVSMLETVK